MKRRCRLPDLARAARLEVVRHRPPFAEGIHRLGEPQNGPDLVAQEQDRDREQDDRRAHHPEQEDVRVRGIGLRAYREEAQDGIHMLHADLDVPRLPDSVDPERAFDLTRDFPRERPVEQIEERLLPRFRQVSRRQDLHRQVQPVARDADDLVVFVGRRGLVDVDQRGDVARGRLREAPRHVLPVALHEHEGDHAFEHDDRRDDDDERAGVEALRHHLGEQRSTKERCAALRCSAAGADASVQGPERLACPVRCAVEGSEQVHG